MLEVIITIKFVNFILLNRCLYIDVLHTLFKFFFLNDILCALFNKKNPLLIQNHYPVNATDIYTKSSKSNHSEK